jgi:hypothetical protein
VNFIGFQWGSVALLHVLRPFLQPDSVFGHLALISLNLAEARPLFGRRETMRVLRLSREWIQAVRRNQPLGALWIP